MFSAPCLACGLLTAGSTSKLFERCLAYGCQSCSVLISDTACYLLLRQLDFSITIVGVSWSKSLAAIAFCIALELCGSRGTIQKLEDPRPEAGNKRLPGCRRRWFAVCGTPKILSFQPWGSGRCFHCSRRVGRGVSRHAGIDLFNQL